MIHLNQLTCHALSNITIWIIIELNNNILEPAMSLFLKLHSYERPTSIFNAFQTSQSLRTIKIMTILKFAGKY